MHFNYTVSYIYLCITVKMKLDTFKMTEHGLDFTNPTPLMNTCNLPFSG